MSLKLNILAALTALPAMARAQTADSFPWSGFGPVDTAYGMTIDTGVAFSGHWSLLLYSRPGATAQTWIASHQIVDARAYRGQRVRIRAHMKTMDATAAGLWVVIDGTAGQRGATLVSDSLTPQLQGNADWRDVALVFDVPQSSNCIRYGSMLHGVGAAWLDAVVFELVPSTILTTVRTITPRPFDSHTTVAGNCRGMISAPADLDFEQAP